MLEKSLVDRRRLGGNITMIKISKPTEDLNKCSDVPD